MLRFFDAHPWFLPTVAGIATLIGAGYHIAAWSHRMMHAWWQRREEKQIIEYLAMQLNPGPFVRNGYGQIPRRQKDCTVKEIARSLRKKPVKVLAIPERLEQQHQVGRSGMYGEWWCISDHELDGRE